MSPDAKPQGADSGQTLACCMLMITMLIMFDQKLRWALGSAVGVVLFPLIGFDLTYPFLTLLCAALIMSTISIGTRNHFMDWVGMAKMQKVNKAFQAEMKEARLAGNAKRVEKLTKYQQEMMKDQLGIQTNTMKPMAYTMLIIISIYTWVWIFIGELPNTTFSVPWAYNVSFTQRLPFCFIPLPAWVGAYSLLSIPLGQVFTHILKSRNFAKRLAEPEETWLPKEDEDGEPEDSHEEEEDAEDEEWEDLEEDEEQEGKEAAYICSECGAGVPAGVDKCPKCGEEFD